MGDTGWFLDPLGRHDDRWISDGRPTWLVRDNEVEGRDEPPSAELPDAPLTPSTEVQVPAGGFEPRSTIAVALDEGAASGIFFN